MRVLMIYIEPAPYILDLIRVLREEHPALRLHVLFIEAAATQPWGEMPAGEGLELLPPGRFAALKRISSLIRYGEFDWLHLAGWGHPLLAISLLTGSLSGRKISMESDTQLPFEPGLLKSAIKRLLMPLLFAPIDLFFPGGSRQKALLLHYGVPEAKIRVAQMTVDVQRIISLASQIKIERRERIRSEMGVVESACLFVFVGRLEDHKGIGLLLEAFSQPDEQAGLLIVGDGACRDLVEHAAAKDTRIHYVGRRDFEGVVEAFAVADVAVVPSTFEPWGLVVNEAMAAGLPVIASDRVGAVDDLVVGGRNGVLFGSGDAQQLGKKMRMLANSQQQRDSMGNAAIEMISGWDLSAEAEIVNKGWKDA